ncbi:colicin-B, partial [Escherichia coli]|nr:colicin-B [Escherichia coli]
FFSVAVGSLFITAGVSVTAVGLMGIIFAGFIGALIDDDFVDKLNNEIIRPAY